MEIKNTTVYDKDVLKACALIQLYRKRARKNSVRVRVIIALVILLLIVLANIVEVRNGAPLSVLLTPAITVVLYILIVIMAPKRLAKLYRKMEGTVNQYTFTDDEFVIESVSDGISGQSRIRYDSILKVCETTEYLLMYLKTNAIMLVDKRDMQEDNLGQVKDKLLAAVGKKKYYQYKY